MPNRSNFAEDYFKTLIPPRDALLVHLEKEAEGEGIPIVGPVMGNLLQILAQTARARNILELGTATGYSAIFLARGCRDFGGKVTTLEKDPETAERAKTNIRSAGLEEHVEVVIGDALHTLAALDPPYDLIFLDIEKEDYLRALPHCHRLLRVGGLLAADNVSFEGADPFNQAIFADKRFRSVSLYAYLPQHSPEKDALCLAVRSE
jgi:predicted O-methyltransferase YrrM